VVGWGWWGGHIGDGNVIEDDRKKEDAEMEGES